MNAQAMSYQIDDILKVYSDTNKCSLSDFTLIREGKGIYVTWHYTGYEDNENEDDSEKKKILKTVRVFERKMEDGKFFRYRAQGPNYGFDEYIHPLENYGWLKSLCRELRELLRQQWFIFPEPPQEASSMNIDELIMIF